VTGVGAIKNISEGSVATPLRYGGIFNVNKNIANFSEIVSVKEFLKSTNIC